MKKIFISAVVLLFFHGTINAQQSIAEVYATKITKRMRDSLSISDEQKTQIYNASMQISQQKAAVWQQYAGSDSLIRVNLQRIEDSRDSLYRPVLGEEKYQLYLEKRRVIISNN